MNRYVDGADVDSHVKMDFHAQLLRGSAALSVKITSLRFVQAVMQSVGFEGHVSQYKAFVLLGLGHRIRFRRRVV